MTFKLSDIVEATVLGLAFKHAKAGSDAEKSKVDFEVANYIDRIESPEERKQLYSFYNAYTGREDDKAVA